MGLKELVHCKAIELDKDVLRMTTTAGSGHPSSALSIMHIVITLMHHVMRWDPADPWHPGNDRLVLSGGHAVPAVYAAYADLGGVVGKDIQSAQVLTKDDLARLREADSPLDGHPNPDEGFPFFDAATGSLGQGLSVGAGLAWAARRRGLDRQIYVILGDGESREGQIWEAMDLIADEDLTNIVAIFNCNGQGQADLVSSQQSTERLAAKAEAFGWQAVVLDGHDADALAAALANRAKRTKPLVLVARTEKGWGCESLKDKSNHGKPVPADRLDAALAELDAMYEHLGISRGACDSESASKLRPHRPAGGSSPAPCVDRNGFVNTSPALQAVSAEAAPTHPEPGSIPFDQAIEAAGLAAALKKGKMATRRAYGAALLAMGAADERIVALDGDVRNSTFSEIFAAQFPQRFIECKIAEQNMVSMAVGLAAAGLIPFVSSFAKFIARAYDQIEMAQIGRANIKLVGSHAGISLAADGPSQMSLHDVAYFRGAAHADNGHGRPACVVFHPCDAVAAYHCAWLMAAHEGMCYMRTHRPDVPLVYAPDTPFQIGGSQTLVEGDALTIVTAGYMVHVCREAIVELAADGIPCTLIDAYSFPMKIEPILSTAARTGGRILCVEDNYLGGLASEVAEAASAVEGIRVEAMTCRTIPKSAKTPAAIMAYVGLAPSDITRRVRAVLGW